MNKDLVFTQCEVRILQNEKFVLSLAAGIAAVCKFAKLADAGIEGVTKIERSFNCNRDVYMSGEMLLNFIEKEYPEIEEEALKNIDKTKATYKIVCYDMS